MPRGQCTGGGYLRHLEPDVPGKDWTNSCPTEPVAPMMTTLFLGLGGAGVIAYTPHIPYLVNFTTARTAKGRRTATRCQNGDPPR